MAPALSPTPAPTERPGALVFIGFMGAGKSSAAREVARALGTEGLDCDRLLEQRLGHSIEREFELHGEDAFRGHEEALVLEVLGRAVEGDVVALGGGSVMAPGVQAALARHTVVLLEVDLETAWTRARGRGRPLAHDRERFAERYAGRSPVYAALADARLPAGDRGLVLRALPALRQLACAPAGTRLLWAASASGEYPAFVGRGLLGAPPWPALADGGRRVCVTDELVAPLHARRLGPFGTVVEIGIGEAHKTLAEAERVWSALARWGAGRADQLVAVGGGVVGDLAGFCAATYQRGIGVVHVPTTLVAQVDSAYGGKTGIDLPEAKNYVGAYHQPQAVLADPGVLVTLPQAEFAAGWVEVLKTAIIAGGELWRRVAGEAQLSDGDIYECVATKLAVVAEDERDEGRRQALNLGHTVGHAIETATGYRRFRHGEAVGLGLLAALRLSDQEQLRTQVASLLGARGLPTGLEGVDAEEVVRATTRDKKRLGGRVPFVLVRAPGDVRTGCEVSDADLRAAVDELVGARPRDGGAVI